jgi:hypothetical protein
VCTSAGSTELGHCPPLCVRGPCKFFFIAVSSPARPQLLASPARPQLRGLPSRSSFSASKKACKVLKSLQAPLFQEGFGDASGPLAMNSASLYTSCRVWMRGADPPPKLVSCDLEPACARVLQPLTSRRQELSNLRLPPPLASEVEECHEMLAGRRSVNEVHEVQRSPSWANGSHLVTRLVTTAAH